MNRGLYIARKNYLLTLVNKLSRGHGGDTEIFLQKHFSDLLIANPDDSIELAIKVYEEQVSKLIYYPERMQENGRNKTYRG